jgi:hypothetical protein
MAPLPKVGGMGGGNTQQSGTAVNGADYRCRWVRQGCSPGLSPFTCFRGGRWFTVSSAPADLPAAPSSYPAPQTSG